LLSQVLHLPGDILEVGVWRGGTGVLLAARSQSAGSAKAVYLCDTFAGVVKASELDGAYRGGEHSDTSPDVVRRLIQERTKAGLAAARARGRTGGRPPLTPNDAKVALATKLFADKSVDLDDICATLKISKTTLYRYVEIATGRVIRSRNHPH